MSRASDDVNVALAKVVSLFEAASNGRGRFGFINATAAAVKFFEKYPHATMRDCDGSLAKQLKNFLADKRIGFSEVLRRKHLNEMATPGTLLADVVSFCSSHETVEATAPAMPATEAYVESARSVTPTAPSLPDAADCGQTATDAKPQPQVVDGKLRGSANSGTRRRQRAVGAAAGAGAGAGVVAASAVSRPSSAQGLYGGMFSGSNQQAVSGDEFKRLMAAAREKAVGMRPDFKP